MGIEYSCSGQGTSQYKPILLKNARNLDITLESLSKLFDEHVAMLKSLLKNRVTDVEDRSGHSNSDNQYPHLKRFSKEMHAFFENVSELLSVVRDKYKVKDEEKQRHINMLDEKSGNFKISELIYLEKYINGLEQKNKDLSKPNRTNNKEEDNTLSRKSFEGIEKDLILLHTNVRDSAKDENKATLETKQDIHDPLSLVVPQTTKDSLLYENIKTSRSVETENKVTKIQVTEKRNKVEKGNTEKAEDICLSSEYVEGKNTKDMLKQSEVITKGSEDITILSKTDCSKSVKLSTNGNYEALHLRPEENETLQCQKEEVLVLRKEIEDMKKKMDSQNVELVEQKEAFQMLKQKKESLESEIKTISKLKKSVENHLEQNIQQNDAIKSKTITILKYVKEYELGRPLHTSDDEVLWASVDNLTVSVQKLIEENRSFTGSNGKMKATQTSAKLELEKQIEDLKQEVGQLKTKAKLFEDQKDALNTQNNASIAKLNETKNELDELRKSKAEMERTFMSKTQDYQSLQLENRRNSQMIVTQKSAMVKLETQITDLKQEVEHLRINVNVFEEQTEALETQNNARITKLNELTSELDNLRESKAEMEMALRSKTQDYENLALEHESLKQDIEKSKRTKVIHVQLYHHKRMYLISKIEKDLKALLKKEMEDAMTKLDFVECDKARDIDLNYPVLILCVCVSRLGTDAANAIQALTLTSKMALVIFHHKEEHALPEQASERLLTGQAFMRLGGILDLAFLRSKGIYNCEINIKNIKSLVDFINKESKKSVE